MAKKNLLRFYYSDGTYSDYKPKSPMGIQAIVQQTKYSGTFLASGTDWYIQDNGEWIGVDIYGALDWMMAKGYLLQGRTVANETFDEVMKNAIEYKNSAK